MMDATVTSIGAGGHTRVRSLATLVTATDRDMIRAEANRWIKSLRLVPYDGQTMRQRFHYRGDSLWWFTELYLHKMRRLEHAVATIIALEAVCREDEPQRVAIRSGHPAVQSAAQAFGQKHGVAIVREAAPRGDVAGNHLKGFLVGPAALLSRVRRRTLPKPARPPRVAAFLHTAFWKSAAPAGASRESYIGAVLDAVATELTPVDLAYVGLGRRRNFRARRWWDPLVGQTSGPDNVTPIERLAPSRALVGSLELWRQRDSLAQAVTSGDAIRAAGSWRGYDLWPVLSEQLQQAAIVQWPWSARSMDEAAAALAHLRPEVIVTYAEAGGWGRALMLESRRAGVPSVGLQHGFIYRHWLNYEHEPDELGPDDGDSGFPHPDRTLVFDGYAAETLTTTGRLPVAAIAITGSPRLDELASRMAATSHDRGARREQLGVSSGQHLLVLAAKFIEIADELPAIVAAVAGRQDLRLIIKPHPAETADVYRVMAEDAPNVTIASASADLGHLLSAADGIITMNSTVAIDGLCLGVPALAVGLPSNLSPFVEAGVMIGASGEAIRAGVETLLYDQPARQRLVERAAAFAALHRMKSDGQAARRAAGHILAMRTATHADAMPEDIE